ncbi:30S ribosomal protein S1 [Amylolactobacillus amylotrophicus DSM 20534]|uniref:30S ribosomal protein S1 n=3 Tax=Amylolactobacillus TaxID=2767876 RepID=A0A0R1YKP6_9LACO|nr:MULTISPECIES: 30S ribosomal protein S1 [Amylolactobacillus]APT19169.1 30S ribosomal protein S1 [Amylolactobacillus amylophilus DSM 20533 = JCM 1125]KRK38560.1 30S ribosomal protein S1 [Amylolactobacillus amylotrophicus DSM 20534]KRM42797.1 30S ribosomal protein S1 [Amylolactobacillus amylophilus DSM 20533 = JCM 1125]GED79660.1 30S ribosomal protein S1 [Amylolactobacillus amylophilus]
MVDNNNFMMDALQEMNGVEVGKIVNVEVLTVEDSQIVVGVVGAGVEGTIQKKEYTHDYNAKLQDLVKVGDQFEALVLRKASGDKENGEFLFSTTRLKEREAFKALEADFEAGKVIEGKVTGSVRGGLLVDVGTRGFLPASLISDHYVSDLKPYIGQTLQLKISEIDATKNRLVLSRKDLLAQEHEEAFERVASKLMVGDVVTGKVSRLTSFGAFVDLGGVDGLVHISEISYKRVEKTSDVLKPDQEIQVKVIGIDTDKQRISLSIKQTEVSPFEKATNEIKPGDIVDGEVKSLTDFGAFVEIANGIQGLVHVSEIANEHVKVPSDKLAVGDKVQVKVLSIDTNERRISLSIKQVNEPADDNDSKADSDEDVTKKYLADQDNGFAVGDLIGDQLKD